MPLQIPDEELRPFDAYYVDETVGSLVTSFNSPPEKPTISGLFNGKPEIEYNYTVSAEDSDGDEIYYYVDWGDDNNTGWLGPYQSNHEAVVYHTWNNTGTYTIKAKTKDSYEVESDWTIVEVSIPKDKIVVYKIIHRFMINHQTLYDLIKYLFELFRHKFNCSTQ